MAAQIAPIENRAKILAYLANIAKNLKPFLRERSLDGRFVLTDKGRLSKQIQKEYGDAFLNGRDGRLWAVEIKTEESEKYGNFFLEMWSNKSRFTIGWLFTLNCDFLWYYFIESKKLYCIDWLALKQWGFSTPTSTTTPKLLGRLWAFPERQQKKFNQLNDTWGRCVPIEIIRTEVGFRVYDLSDYPEMVDESVLVKQQTMFVGAKW